jgi:hypothetical protein
MPVEWPRLESCRPHAKRAAGCGRRGSSQARGAAMRTVKVQQFTEEDEEFYELGDEAEVMVTDEEWRRLEEAQEIIWIDRLGGFYCLAE